MTTGPRPLPRAPPADAASSRWRATVYVVPVSLRRTSHTFLPSAPDDPASREAERNRKRQDCCRCSCRCVCVCVCVCVRARACIFTRCAMCTQRILARTRADFTGNVACGASDGNGIVGTHHSFAHGATLPACCAHQRRKSRLPHQRAALWRRSGRLVGHTKPDADSTQHDDCESW